MLIIKCDICNKDMEERERRIVTDFTTYECTATDLCEDCYKIYKDKEQSYLEEQQEIYEKRQKDISNLKEKYKKEILKLRENS